MKNRIIIISCIILSSCCLGKNDTYRYVGDEMYPVYKEGDTLFYKSNWNNLDTFIYGGYGKHYDCQSNEDYCNTETCYESLWLSYNNIKWPKVDSQIFAIHQSSYIGNFEYMGFIGGFRDSLLISSITIGGFLYENVYYNEIKYFMETNIVSSYYSYSYGLIQFEEDNGQIWVLERN
jgi:hypothetical protein